MTSNSEIVKQRFAKELTRCCGSHFTAIPSNEQFARDFFLSSKYQLKISREAVRKWFKGEIFPDLANFLHLIKWLNLDISRIYVIEEEFNFENKHTNYQYLNIDGAEQITAEQIDAFVALLSEIKINKLGNLDKKNNSR